MRIALRAEQIPVGHDALEGFEDVGTVVDEVGDLEFSAVDGFLGSLPAEADVFGVDVRRLEESVVFEPLS